MIIYITIIILLFISNFIVYFTMKKDYQNKVNKEVKKELQKMNLEIDRYYEEYGKNKINTINVEFEKKYKELEERFNSETALINSKLSEKRGQICVLDKEISLKEELIQRDKKSIDAELSLYKEKELEKIKYKIEKETEQQLEEQESKLQTHMAAVGAQSAAIQEELIKLQSSLNDYYDKQKIINQAILRQRELSEKETFYKLNLTESEIQDIIYIKEFENKFSNKELLQKAVYECYYKKPLADLIKRVLRGEEFSGIYKITSLKTNEIYIGRAVNIKKRWTDHIKSSMGIGTLVSSTIHKRLAADGVWNFTFEVLEEIEKDKLNEREAYWVDFYQSNIYGMNEKKGG